MEDGSRPISAPLVPHEDTLEAERFLSTAIHMLRPLEIACACGILVHRSHVGWTTTTCSSTPAGHSRTAGAVEGHAIKELARSFEPWIKGLPSLFQAGSVHVSPQGHLVEPLLPAPRGAVSSLPAQALLLWPSRACALGVAALCNTLVRSLEEAAPKGSRSGLSMDLGLYLGL